MLEASPVRGSRDEDQEMQTQMTGVEALLPPEPFAPLHSSSSTSVNKNEFQSLHIDQSPNNRGNKKTRLSPSSNGTAGVAITIRSRLLHSESDAVSPNCEAPTISPRRQRRQLSFTAKSTSTPTTTRNSPEKEANMLVDTPPPSPTRRQRYLTPAHGSPRQRSVPSNTMSNKSRTSTYFFQDAAPTSPRGSTNCPTNELLTRVFFEESPSDSESCGDDDAANSPKHVRSHLPDYRQSASPRKSGAQQQSTVRCDKFKAHRHSHASNCRANHRYQDPSLSPSQASSHQRSVHFAAPLAVYYDVSDNGGGDPECVDNNPSAGRPEEMNELYYTNADLQSFIRQAQVMAHRARRSVQLKAEQAPIQTIKYYCRGLEDLMTIQASVMAKQRRKSVLRAVLLEMDRQKQVYYSNLRSNACSCAVGSETDASGGPRTGKSPAAHIIWDLEAIRTKSRLATRQSRRLARVYAKQDAFDAKLEKEPRPEKPNVDLGELKNRSVQGHKNQSHCCSSTVLSTETSETDQSCCMTPAYQRASQEFADGLNRIARADKRLNVTKMEVPEDDNAQVIVG